jgi:hypothetical protein
VFYKWILSPLGITLHFFTGGSALSLLTPAAGLCVRQCQLVVHDSMDTCLLGHQSVHISRAQCACTCVCLWLVVACRRLPTASSSLDAATAIGRSTARHGTQLRLQVSNLSVRD